MVFRYAVINQGLQVCKMKMNFFRSLKIGNCYNFMLYACYLKLLLRNRKKLKKYMREDFFFYFNLSLEKNSFI